MNFSVPTVSEDLGSVTGHHGRLAAKVLPQMLSAEKILTPFLQQCTLKDMLNVDETVLL
jgi:hypothetical protein